MSDHIFLLLIFLLRSYGLWFRYKGNLYFIYIFRRILINAEEDQSKLRHRDTTKALSEIQATSTLIVGTKNSSTKHLIMLTLTPGTGCRLNINQLHHNLSNREEGRIR